MKIKERPRLELLYRQDNLIIPLEKGQIRAVHEFLNTVGQIDPAKDYTVKIEPTKRRRSIDANNYCWSLLGALAMELSKEKTPVKKEELYREYVKDYGTYEIVPIREDAVDRWIKNWERKGLGWVCERLGKSKLPNYENIVCYFGSSTYDTKEMSRLIDAVVADCKEQGIETMTPDEIERLKEQWNTQ